MSRSTPGRSRLAILAVSVDRDQAESALEKIISLKALDKSRKVLRIEERVEIPVSFEVEGFQIVSQESPNYYRSGPDLVSALDGEKIPGKIPEEMQGLLPRGWFILGDVIVVKIHPELQPYEPQIGRALLECYPRCQTVLADDGISGPLREPVRRTIAGERTRTVHRENGVVFHLDASVVMFSPGNLKERIRMSRLGRGETVLDMFAGIGYFTIPMAVHSRPERIIAIEINPNAHRFLCENIRQNHVQDIVEPVLGDCEKMAPEGVADRVVMGMVQVTDRYLAKGISALKPGGILHYHQTIPSWLYPERAIEDVTQAAEALGRSAGVMGFRRVKKFSPGVVHVVIDARIDR